MKISIHYLLLPLIAVSLLACQSPEKKKEAVPTYADVQVVGAMKHVMWNGELGANIELDTIQNKKHLYGLGPESYLRGEILVVDGRSYTSKVVSDSTMVVSETFEASAPFFVYANVEEWDTISVPSEVNHLAALEAFIDQQTKDTKQPFAFKVVGKLISGTIHVQNLPVGTSVSSPAEAHQGQINYELHDEMVTMVGFFSKEHQGIFTHHDTFLHMHLITEDVTKMGHLDHATFENVVLFLPKLQ